MELGIYAKELEQNFLLITRVELPKKEIEEQQPTNNGAVLPYGDMWL
jgi:hypothetical protein